METLLNLCLLAQTKHISRFLKYLAVNVKHRKYLKNDISLGMKTFPKQGWTTINHKEGNDKLENMSVKKSC